MKIVGLTVTIIALMFASSVFNGWAFTILWGWFVVPVFGLPALSIPAAIGFCMTVGFLTTNMEVENKGREFKDVLIEGVCKIIGKVLACLGCGWVVVQFI